MLLKIDVPKKFCNFHMKVPVLSYEMYKIFKNIFFTEHIWWLLL